MKAQITVALILTSFTFLSRVPASAFFAVSDIDVGSIPDFPDVSGFLYYSKKRSCIRRGRSCDQRPSSCCVNSTCRCNLWGTNCRCQRMGLFQRLGR